MQLVEFSFGGVPGPAFNYAFLRRVRRCTEARNVRFLGFTLDERAALLLEGSDDAITRTTFALKAGTSRAKGLPTFLGRTRRTLVYDPLGALVALHRSDHGCPLANAWSSHRDLMGFREAPFFDRAVWAGRIDPRLVHIRSGGGDLPRGFPPPLEGPRRRMAADGELDLCLRVAAAVVGVLPSDRRATRLFTHLGRHAGMRQVDLAEAVLLTPRRIRQLQSQPEPLLGPAALSLRDHRLQRVP